MTTTKPAPTAAPLYNLAEVRRAHAVLVAPGDVVELRALDARLEGQRYGKPGTVSGYASGAEALAKMVARLGEASGIYITINPVVPAVYARRADDVGIADRDALTKDGEIAQRRWLLIDLDPVRPAGISSSTAELATAKAEAQHVVAALRDEGWPDPVVALSGNGWHVLYRIDLPADDQALALVERCLAALAARFNGPGVHVDTKVGNASRICKLYGTAARKGSSTAERPHRMSRLVQVPEGEGGAQVVPLALLEALADQAPRQETPAARRSAGAAGGAGAAPVRRWDLAEWVARYLPDATGPDPWQGGRRWTLPVCPFDEGHARGEAFVAEKEGGAISAGCQHDSCRWGWRELRAKFEPTPEARGLEALEGVRAAVKALPPDLTDADLVASLGPVYDALLVVPPGALRDAACAEAVKALKPRAKSLSLKSLRADVVKQARAKAGTIALGLGSDVELAAHVLDDLEREGEQLIHDRGRLWRYDRPAGIWRQLEPKDVRLQVAALDGILVRSAESDGARPLLVSARRMRDVYAVCLDRRAQEGWFDAAPRGLAFANGFLVLDERDKALRLEPLVPEHRATVGYEFAYDPEAHPYRFYDLLCDVWPEDNDRDAKIEILRQWVGGALLGLSTRYQRAMVLVGGGANGKSTILNIIRDLFPPENVSAVNPQDMTDEYRRAMLAGKRLNCVSELPEAEILATEAVKALVSGDVITAREIREAPFRFKPEAGHIFSTNSLPAVRDTSRGFWRRWIVLTFSREFQPHEQIRDLDRQVLAAERAEIVSWALRGAEALVATGEYPETAEMRAAREEWQRSADPVSAFVADRCVPIPDVEWGDGETGESAAVLYDEYKRWAEQEGHGRMSSTKFGTRLALTCRKAHTRTGTTYAVHLNMGSGLRVVKKSDGGVF